MTNESGTDGHRMTSVVLGLASLVRDQLAAGWDRLSADRERPSTDRERPSTDRERLGWPNVIVGVLFETEDAVAGLASGVRRAATDARQGSTRRATSLLAGTRRHVARLAGRGAAERDTVRRRAAGAVNAIVDAVASAPIVNRAVDAQVDRVLRPLVAVVLDDVLVRLESEPERIQSLVRGQRESMVDELVGRVRAGAAAGDRTVDRLTSRILGHSAGSAPPPTGTGP